MMSEASSMSPTMVVGGDFCESSSPAYACDSRVRGVFPLPVPACELSEVSGIASLSRSAKRRIEKHIHNDAWFADGIGALNSVSGVPGIAAADAVGSPTRNLTQVRSYDRIRQIYASVPGPPANLTASEAFHALRGAASGYNTDPGQGARVPFSLERCSMPPAMNVTHSCLSSLDGVHHERVEQWRTRILKPEDARRNYMQSSDRVRPYLDPALVRDPGVYGQFLMKLHNAGMLSWRTGIRSWLGCFFVMKKSGKLRIILDTRDVSCLFYTPPHTPLPTGAALGSIESDGDRYMFFAGADISDYFYRLGVPDGMEEFFSLPGLTADFLPDIAKLLRVPKHARLVPCFKVLPMGWSWSLYIAQAVHECRILRLGILPGQVIQDRKPGVSLHDGDTKAAVYVDNHLFVGHNQDDVFLELTKPLPIWTAPTLTLMKSLRAPIALLLGYVSRERRESTVSVWIGIASGGFAWLLLTFWTRGSRAAMTCRSLSDTSPGLCCFGGNAYLSCLLFMLLVVWGVSQQSYGKVLFENFDNSLRLCRCLFAKHLCRGPPLLIAPTHATRGMGSWLETLITRWSLLGGGKLKSFVIFLRGLSKPGNTLLLGSLDEHFHKITLGDFFLSETQDGLNLTVPLSYATISVHAKDRCICCQDQHVAFIAFTLLLCFDLP